MLPDLDPDDIENRNLVLKPLTLERLQISTLTAAEFRQALDSALKR